jgi:glucose-fructose oxidoreductase
VTGSPEKGKKWADDYGFPESSIYGYETMNRIADNKDIDIIYIVTPPGLHAEHAIAAAKTGKHVICEKPMANTVAECDAIIAACREAGVRLGLGYRLHHDPNHLALKRLVRENTYGPFMRMNGQHSFRLGLRNGVKPWRAEHKLAGGGPLMDVGIYVIQAACLAKGEAWPVAVTAREEPKTRPEFFVDVEETLHFQLEFADGAVCEALTSYELRGNQFRAEAEKGWFELQPAFSYRGLKATTSEGPLDLPVINQQAAQMDDFAQCVTYRRDTPVPGEMGRRDMVIIEAIYEAMRTGRRVEVVRS